MSKEESPLGKIPAQSLSKGWHILFFLTAALVAAADQLSKELWIRSYQEGQVIFQAGFFRILHTNNTGAAFGILQDQSLFLTMVAIGGIILILFLALHLYRHLPFLATPLMKLVLGLILGGTIGNLIDRLRFGQVADFISIGIWPTFNLADSAVTIGVILFGYLFIVSNRDKAKLQNQNAK